MANFGNHRLVVGTAIIGVAFASLIVGSMRSTTLNSLPVAKLRAADKTPHSYVGQRLRVVGFVGKAPVRKVPEQTSAGVVNINHFAVVERNSTLAVEYRDALPDTFRSGGPVQVDGVYAAPGRMRADRVLTKCPSKYEAGESYEEKKSARSTDVIGPAAKNT
ncbi:MAG TPA: cytochrome c maturation protein CcmE [Abditibacteriaceae bacterium]|nr:cytochrome c maturation protein CcmE [Abditibacteriaceae bacterium]